MIKKDPLTAFSALGEISMILQERILLFGLDSIFDAINNSLTSRLNSVEVLKCIGHFAKALGTKLLPQFSTVLENMFSYEMSQTLVDSLCEVAKNIPPLQRPIQRKLLLIISSNLTPSVPTNQKSTPGANPNINNPPVRSPAPNRKAEESTTQTSTFSFFGRAPAPEVDKESIILLSLTGLTKFDFDPTDARPVLSQYIVPYLTHESATYRKLAVTACSKLLLKEKVVSVRGYSSQVATEILLKLFRVAMTDLDPSIRLDVLKSFDTRYDKYLCQPDFLYQLFLFLHDPVFEVQETTILLIGRLGLSNPAVIYPMMRTTFMGYLKALDFADVENKERSVELFRKSVRALPELIKPYAEPIIKILLEKLKSEDLGSVALYSYCLAAVGDVVSVAGEQMTNHIKELLPLVIDSFGDQTSSKKQMIALRTLGEVIQSTGLILETLSHDPKLLDTILLKIKRATSSKIVHELLRFLGVLGSIDPYRHKMLQQDIIEKEESDSSSMDPREKYLAQNYLLFKEFLRGIPPQSGEYYPSVALELLMRLLMNQQGILTNIQMAVIEAVMTIFKSMERGCVPYLRFFMPPLIEAMKTSGTHTPGLREFLFKQLRILVGIIKHFTRDYLDVFMDMMDEYWDHENLTDQIILLLEEICKVIVDEFMPCLHRFLSRLIKVLNTKSKHAIYVLHSFKIFGTIIDDYLPQILPSVCNLIDPHSKNHELTKAALITLSNMAQIHDLAPFSVLIFQQLMLALDSPADVQQHVLDALCVLLSTYTSTVPFFEQVKMLLSKKPIDHYINTLIQKIDRKESFVPYVPKETSINGINTDLTTQIPRAGKMNSQILRSAWNTQRCFTKSDWDEWFRKLSLTVLQESPSEAIRSCASLAMSNNQVTLELFNAGFVSCWDKLTEENKADVSQSLAIALKSNTVPIEILHTLLDLAEYMERSEKRLPLDIELLGSLSQKCQALAKALYYKEKEAKKEKHESDVITKKTLENLITINDQLGQYEAAQGLFHHAKELKIEENQWYEKLRKYPKALREYERLQEQNPSDMKATLGRIRCLNSLGKWEELVDLVETTRENLASQQQHLPLEIISFALESSVILGKWESMEKNVKVTDKHSFEGAFYRAILYVHKDDHDKSYKFLSKARDLIAPQLTALIGESYRRAYDVVVKVQQLTELEEIMSFKTAKEERQMMIKKLWRNRLNGVERNVEVWQSILATRSLVLPPSKDPTTWVKFANLVRKTRRFRRAHRILSTLLVEGKNLNPTDPIPEDANPIVKYAFINLLWSRNLRDLAYSRMTDWVKEFPHLKEEKLDSKLQSKCYVKLASWQLELHDSLDESIIPSMVEACDSALGLTPDWHKAWHTWAILHYRILKHYAKQDENSPKLLQHLYPAVNGFIKSISLAPGSNLQDTLRFLTLWFTYGHTKEVESVISQIDKINIDIWLMVIPQMIARIHIQVKSVRNGIQQILFNLGKAHPQALVFPITVALKSPFKQRHQAAQTVLDNMQQHSAQLVSEALTVGDELIRVAILWKEKWFKALEEASHFYYVERKVDKMIATLSPLHQMLTKGPTTQHEFAFTKTFGKDLQNAWEFCKEYIKTRKGAAMNRAWDLYAHVYGIIKKQLQSDFEKLVLANVSPQLLKLQNLQLAVPGTYIRSYKSGNPIVPIKSFEPVLKVIPSKQKPRRFTVHGSDGNEFPFLLKGHEDLRQDERVMQLFSLVNKLLDADDITSKNHLTIQRYAVVPLSSDSGLIEWLPQSDTIHELLNTYRKTHKISIEEEISCMQKFCTKTDFYKLPANHKLEIFEYALEQTPGDDLERILWLNSSSAELWLEKRSTYTRSLAVMSMVGYILGLGDRHPNNLMLNRISGKVIHIDFGDCFEVAMLREKFAERVPFRLTRMLVNAMEVSGIRGTFKITCQNVMRVLRENKESIMSVLEAFVYDPLINWRLVKNPSAPTSQANENSSEDEQSDLLNQTEETRNKINSDISLNEPALSSISDDSFNESIDTNKDSENSDNAMGGGGGGGEMNQKALTVLERVSDKLSGREFQGKGIVEVEQQVDLLISIATSNEILSQAFLGWCPYW
eukprot:TRINITY_DN2146_c0_g2_i1.p1 TRINITY_DN2146_c0_g2~~TRINITY_DN2146_c0_g2_i1.p1  ORF type:complete len:2397 (-),score=492.72 TRINITY_DN2146_c0_g2_i1:292-6513(-)